MHITPAISVLLFGILPEVSSATDTTNNCCSALEKGGLANRVVYPNSGAYEKSVGSYWAENVQLDPICIVQPRSARDVSLAVSTLTSIENGACKFAVRSGGHTTWAGANDISNGVTIDLQMMNSTTYNKNNGTASILPGARWQSVYKALSPYDVTVPGGRGGPVGVGGFLIGGGNTFHTARVGFGCDNVENFEVVLASGDIINANKGSHADLYKALKGGSINYGVVTKYEMKTIPGDKLWGGLVVYANSTTSQQLSAAHHFINNIHKDHYASWIGMWEYSAQTDTNVIANALEYTKPVAYPKALQNFTSIPNTTDTMRFANMYNLTQELVQASGYRDVFTTGTFGNDLKVLEQTVKIHNSVIEKAKAAAKSKDWTVDTIIQPWPTLFAEHSQKRGGNVLGLERFDENLFRESYSSFLSPLCSSSDTKTEVLFDYSWKNAADDDLFNELARSALKELTAYSKSIGADNEYIYLNYADGSQNPLAGYGPKNVEYIRRIAKKYDSEGVFQTQVPGGFKISEVCE
ncbi:unnamed protein product [Penicillium salamii]|uniref:FAD-binding PCMH-type domain-containing protein n=1 Tax=Penicillium salamii TaxID=1612424 RepID=A0A9W4N3I3_9EURO|nr:unnamed protein product [Penicillium salamii]CAG8036582.1 unnamed protein product [Penicillium salamii]CAG8089615.1 unnamed protein product [Penicillium salamii]CAG8205989.1 unnamed protein product [Penicillium salamii]CAG8221022.1 unnamed protein product [Penicillium salamii]